MTKLTKMPAGNMTDIIESLDTIFSEQKIADISFTRNRHVRGKIGFMNRPTFQVGCDVGSIWAYGEVESISIWSADNSMEA